MRKVTVLAGLLATLQLATASHVAAQERGFYYGVDVGGSKIETDETINASINLGGQQVVFTTRHLDDEDTAFDARFGYRFTPHLAVEAEYVDLGALTFTTSGPVPGSTPDSITVRFDSGTNGFAASALGILPLSGRWELFGRAGVLIAANSAAVTVSGAANFSGGDSDSARYSVLGLGAAVNVRQRWVLRVEYRAFDEIHDDDLAIDIDWDLRALTVGFVVSRRR